VNGGWDELEESVMSHERSLELESFIELPAFGSNFPSILEPICQTPELCGVQYREKVERLSSSTNEA
jgi:hypothetical protein